MSLLSRIQSNTQSVSDGKYSLVTAIMGKGGDVPLTSNLPTFNQLVQGVESIPEGSEEVVASRGAVHVEALARENIQQYDSVKVLASSGNTAFVGNDLLPTTARYNVGGTETTVSVFFYEINKNKRGISYISETGKFILLSTTSWNANTTLTGSNGLYPFYLVGNEYKQLKIDGVYKPFPAYDSATNNLNGHFASGNYHYYNTIPISVDEINRKIATSYSTNLSQGKITMYDLDIENLNVITDGDLSLLQSYLIHNIILKNDNLFCECSTSSSYFTVYGKIQSDKNISFSNITTNNDGGMIVGYGYTISDDCIYILTNSSTSSNVGRISKFRMNADNNSYVFVTYKKLPYSESAGYNDNSANNIYLNASTTKVFIKNSNNIKVYIINDVNDNITFTDVTSESFIDNSSIFDPTSVTCFAACRGGRYLFALKGDTSLSYAERLVMLEYQFGDENEGIPSGYKVISYPLIDWIPSIYQTQTSAYISILLNQLYFFNSDKYMICKTSVGTTKIYESTNPGTGYYMQKTSNLLSNEVNLYGYGIATENVSTGQVGDASLNVINVF